MESTSSVFERDEVWFVTIYMKLKSEILHLGQCVINVRYRHVYEIATHNILCNLNNLCKVHKFAIRFFFSFSPYILSQFTFIHQHMHTF